MQKRWKITLGIIAGLAVVAMIIYMSPLGRFILTGGLANLEEQPFNSEQWKAVRAQDVVTMRIRLMMLDDLLENNLKKGTDSVAIKEILGEPEREFGFSYSLGAITTGMKPNYLVINFDKAGKMRDTRIESKNTVNVRVD